MNRDTYKVDATNLVLGRVASDIAHHLIGKHKTTFQSHIDGGDVVMVTNVDKLKITGRKLDQKTYYHHSGYPGGIKEKNMGDLFAQNPAEVLKKAVSRMLPKNKHRTERLKRLMIS